jgi:hypothetical protein
MCGPIDKRGPVVCPCLVRFADHTLVYHHHG